MRLVEGASAPGRSDRANEDRWGTSGDAVWVIDGATGLGDEPLLDGPSDAAWLAGEMDAAFRAMVEAGERDPLAILAGAGERIEPAFVASRRRPPRERYEIPTAAVLLAVFEADAVRVAELGDCRLTVKIERAVTVVGGSEEGRALERENAGAVGGAGRSVRTPQVLALLREVRNRANTETGYAIFAPDAGAAGRARRHTLAWNGDGLALLATDGFDALASDYGRYGQDSLVDAARHRGLETLIAEIRTIEHEDDPDRVRFPRFKTSDDATAVLVAGADGAPER